MSVEDEVFYTEPPYKYRPSIAEYLTNNSVTKAGMLADLLHLDKKGNINIEIFEKDLILVKLISDKDLTDNEVFIWDFLKRFEKKDGSGLVEIRDKDITDNVVDCYGLLVRRNLLHKFYGANSPKSVSQGRHSGVIWFLLAKWLYPPDCSERSLPWIKIAIFLKASLLNFLWQFFWPLIAVLILSKFARTPKEIQTFAKSFIKKYIKLTILYFVLMILAMLVTVLVLSAFFVIFPSAVRFVLAFICLMSFVAITILLIFNYGYKLALLICDFYAWLLENKECEEHRANWLRFKRFVCNYSALEDKPLKYYELWDEFYYYALAVGAVKNVRFA